MDPSNKPNRIVFINIDSKIKLNENGETRENEYDMKYQCRNIWAGFNTNRIINHF